MDGSVGTHGTVLDASQTFADYGAVYACGPNPMLAAVKLAAGEGELLPALRGGEDGMR